MKRSFSVGRVVFHPSTLAVFSGLIGALLAFLINLASGGNSSQMLWIALPFAILFNLGITAWQVYNQERTGKQWMTMLQEMVFQTYFLTLLTDKPEVTQIAQQRLGQVLKSLNAAQQLSMLRFSSHNGLPAAFIGDGLQGSTALKGADLHKIELPKINLENTNLSRGNLSEANLSEANLSITSLYHANLSGANLRQASLKGSDLRGVDLRGANLTGADLSDSELGMEKEARISGGAQAGTPLHSDIRANLSNAILSHAKLQGSNLSGADLSGANLQGADLTKTTLIGANLQGADLTQATLTGATLIGANLQGADLTDADLKGATFVKVDLRAAKVTEEQLQTLINYSESMKREP